MKFVAHKISGDVFRVVGSLAEIPGHSVITARSGTLYTIFDDLLTPADQPTDWFPLKYYICPRVNGYLVDNGKDTTLYDADGSNRVAAYVPCESCEEVTKEKAEAQVWVYLPDTHTLRSGIDWYVYATRDNWRVIQENDPSNGRLVKTYPLYKFRCLKINAPKVIPTFLTEKTEELGFSLVGGVPGGMLYFRASDEALKD